MKVAVATSQKSPDSEISEMAGRAPFYLIFNEKGEAIEKIKNPFRMGGGAGFSVAKMLSDEDVKVVIAGNMGSNMKEALEERGIKVEIRKGKASEAVKGII